MIRLIASDLDGTLFHSDRSLGKAQVEAVRRTLDAGMVFVAATGRSYEAAYRLVRSQIPEAVLLTLDGAQVWEGDRLVIQHMLSGVDCEKIYEVLRDFPVHVKFNGPLDCYMVGEPDEVKENIRKFIRDLRQCDDAAVDEDTYFQDLMAGLHVVKSPADIPGAGKVFCFTNETEKIEEMVRALKNRTDFHVVSSGPENFEVTVREASKGPVLKAYADSLGIAPDQVQVFGDSLNDLSMMEQGFHSMAVGNAHPRIREAADEVGPSNDEDGVAWKIQQILKG